MKKFFLVLLTAVIVMVLFCFAHIVKEKNHFFIGHSFFNANYISTHTTPGKDLKQSHFTPDDLLNITIDGKMDEDIWVKSQEIGSFYTDNRELDKGVKVNVLSDRENIYLFWEVENSGDITAAIHQNDSALVGDDYVQVNLKPLIPDSIKYARDYSFSIAVNTNEAVWDAYFDPYHEGYFFTNWASNTQVKTIKKDQNYSMEMAIPFSDLDIYSDPGWAWNLTFNRAEAGSRKISTSSIGVSVIQNIKVRNPRMVGYYWPREEFWPDIIPDLKGIEKPESRAGKLSTSPKKNRMRDDVWSDCEEISLCYDNKTTERIKGETAKARVGYDKNNLYILLLSPDPFPVKTTQDEKDTGEGMSRQLKGLDGVYRDLSVETSESFWILFQPGSIKGDAPHQDYYFITVDFAGNSTNIRYDSHGKPIKTWHSQLEADIFKTVKNWGIELTIPLIHLNIPHEYSSKWRMNIMYNVPKAEGSTIEGFSDIQAWYPTLKDERNPEKTGIVHALDMDYNTYVKRTFERRVNELSNDIISLKEVPENELNELKNELKAIRKEIKSGNPAKIKRQLEMLDVKMGIAEEKSLFTHSPDIPNDGYPLNDVHFMNPQKGFAVGALGLILQTEDGGETWEKQRSLTDCSLSELFFLNENEGWIAGGRIRSAETNESMSHDERGGDGIILYTKNGGESWEIQFAKRGTYLFDVFFTDSSHGWAVGEGGLLLRTTDGGKLWSHVPTTGTIKWMNGIYFFDKLNGILVGESETVLKTDDGGDTWEKVHAEADRKFYDFRSFYRDITFIGNKGWIVGQNGTILSSSDKGETWEPQATEFDEKVRELMDLRKVFFLDEDRGYALGGLGSRMMKTENGGLSWSMVHVPNADQNHGGWFDSQGNGFLVGARSKILKTKDHAKNWITVNGNNKNIDLLIFTAHGDDSPIQHGFLMTYLSKIEKRDIAAIHVTRDTHSNEYKGEYYDYECDRSHHLMGVKTTMHFDEFDTGNSGSTSFHINLRLWKGYHEIERHMVAAIRAYRPDVVITHDPIFGEYDKPGHKIAGRAGFMAFYNSGIPDQFPELTRLGLKPHQPQKLYTYATQAFPATYEYESILEIPLEGYGENIEEWANRSLRCFQSQGIHFVKHTPLHLVKSFVEVPEEEGSIFEGL